MVSFLRRAVELSCARRIAWPFFILVSASAGVLLLYPRISSGLPRPFGPPLFAPQDTSKELRNPKVLEAQQQSQQGRSQGRSRLGGRGSSGTTVVESDSLRRLRAATTDDSTWVVYLDSTARLQYWKHRRRDLPMVKLFPDRVYPLYATPSQSPVRRELLPDSTVTSFRLREQVGGENVKIPLNFTLREYISARRKYELRKLFADEAHKPPVIQGKKDISDVLSSFTKIQIPIPANPILSIFGKPEINLQISGAVDIRAGFRNTKSDQTTANFLDQSRNEPDFN